MPSGTFPKKSDKLSGVKKSSKGISKKTKKAKVKSDPKKFNPSKPTQYFEAYESDEDEEITIPTMNSKTGTKPFTQQGIPEYTLESSDTGEDSESESDFGKQKIEDKRVKVNVLGETEDEEKVGNEDEQEDEEDGERGDLTAKKFREEMANLPLSEVRKMRDNLGMKLFDKLYFNNQPPEENKKAKKEKQEKAQQEKRGQHRPREVSSKKKVGTFRNVYKNERMEKKKWDPRFDERAGLLKEHCFEDNYQFLNDMRKDEREELRKELAIAVESGDKTKSERVAKDQERTRKERDLKKSAMDEIRQVNIDRLVSGEKAKFLTKAQVRMKVMEKKYEQLKSENRLDSYLQKKAKKQAQKEKKKKHLVEQPFEKKYGYH